MKKKNWTRIAGIILIGIVAVISAFIFFFQKPEKYKENDVKPKEADVVSVEKTKEDKNLSNEQKKELQEKFATLGKINIDTVAHVYIPGTELDEPVVQGKDNSTYLSKTFEGYNVPYLGSVFLDVDSSSDFTDRLTWMFGHARGSQVFDHRMFNDVNYFEDQDFANKHNYMVVETPTKIHYYELFRSIVVPYDTPLYKNSFKDDEEFKQQLEYVDEHSKTRGTANIDVKAKYLVMSTCREDAKELRTNLYWKEISDEQVPSFLEKHKDEIKYKKVR